MANEMDLNENKSAEATDKEQFSADNYSMNIDLNSNRVRDVDNTQTFTTSKMGVGSDIFEIRSSRNELENMGEDVKDLMNSLRKEYLSTDHRNANYGQNNLYSGISETESGVVSAYEFNTALNLMKRFNEEVYGNINTKDGPFATLDENGKELDNVALTDIVQKFQKTVLRDAETELDNLRSKGEAQITVGGIENDERYKILKQQFNNPEILRKVSPESYDVLMNIKSDQTLSEDEQLQRYFEVCDTNAVEQGMFSKEQVKFYNANVLSAYQPEQEQSEAKITMTEYGLDMPQETWGKALKSLLRGENFIAEAQESSPQQELQLQAVEEVAKESGEYNLTPLTPEAQEQLNNALSYQNNAAEELNAAATQYANTPDNNPSLSNTNSLDLRNTQSNKMTPKPTR